MRMQDRVVLVTGASRGIGAATAKLLASEGAAVAVNYFQSAEPAEKVAASIRAAGGTAFLTRADVRDQAQVQAMVAETEKALGPIDTLVSNASIGFPVAPFLEYPWEAFEAKLTGELRAAFFCCRAVAPGMAARRNGCIVAISSGLSRVPGPGFSAHSAAKSALDGFAKSLALELGPLGIRVNVIAPGLTLTDATVSQPQDAKDAAAKRTPLRRNGMPDDVAAAVLALASDDARFITGAYVPVSGGIQMV